jgi:hypothetical protein
LIYTPPPNAYGFSGAGEGLGEKMNRKLLNTKARGNMSLTVYPDLPTGYIELHRPLDGYRMARYSINKYMYFCHWKECNGWISGDPIEREENSMSHHHPLSGRSGTVFLCRRCGGEIGFSGAVA